MKLLSRFKAALRSFADPSPEVVRLFGGSVKTRSGENVNSASAMSASSVFACVRNISEDVAKLPLVLYRSLDPEGKERLVDDPLYTLLHDSPNPEMSSFVFRQAVTACALLGGNGYAEIERNGGGRPIALWPLMWKRVQAKRSDKGELYYLVDQKDRIPAADMLHVPGFSVSGVLGEMITMLGKEAIGLALAGEKFAASFFGNGAMPGGVLEHPGELGEEGMQNVRKGWNDQHQGADAAHNIAILEEGMKYNKIGAAPDEAQMVESRQFQVEDVARFFRVPPHKIGHLLRASGWSTLEASNTDYVIDTLMPWMVRWEQEIKRKVIPAKDRKVFVEHLVSGLLRGDTAARFDAYGKAISAGWMNRDEVRSLENLNPIPDGKGKTFLVPLNMAPATVTGAKPDTSVDPGPGNTAPAPVADTPPNADAAARAAIVAAHKTVLNESFARLIRIETDKRARSKADAAFWQKHREHVAEQVSPSLRALAVSLMQREPGEDWSAEVAAVAQLHVTRSEKGENAPAEMSDLASTRMIQYAERSNP